MGLIIGISIFLLLSSELCLGDGDFVSKGEFVELKRMVNILKNTVNEGKRKYDDLDRKYKHLEGKLHDVLFELDEIKFRLQSTDQRIPEASNIVEKSKLFRDNKARQKRHFHRNSTDRKTRNEIIADLFSQRTNPKTKGPKQRSISSFPRRDSGYQQVAFFARGIVDKNNLGYHQTVVFKDTITNLGYDYQESSGVFICSKAGVYAFFLSTVTVPGGDIHTAIVKNGVDASRIYVSDPDRYSQASTMAVLWCNPGDNVWVRITHHAFASGTAFSDYENVFSGFLL